MSKPISFGKIEVEEGVRLKRKNRGSALDNGQRRIKIITLEISVIPMKRESGGIKDIDFCFRRQE